MNNYLTKHTRSIIKVGFVLFVLILGFQFYFYVDDVLNGSGTASRPNGVEGFLPVSALLGLKYLLATGEFDPVHPAGLAIFLSILFLSFLLAKAFCSWLCPFGSGCEAMQLAGKKTINKTIKFPKWLDFCLRGLKYILLAAFIYGILIAMDPMMITNWIYMPYNIICDVAMLKFLLAPSLTFLGIIGLVAVANFFGISLWCRYFCPYGALLGLLGLIGPTYIKRHEDKCINCNQCSKVCPSYLPVATKKYIKSPECNLCGDCINNCPVEDALQARFFKLSLKPWLIGVVLLVLFISLTTYAKLTGHWESTITTNTFKEMLNYQRINL